eukprot:766991-Hanusia_phi.AAC.13
MSRRSLLACLALCAAHAHASFPSPYSALYPAVYASSLSPAGQGQVDSSRGSSITRCPWGMSSSGSGTMRLRGGMIIYKDISSGDEMISDSFQLQDIDDVLFKVKTKHITKGALDVGIAVNQGEEDGDAAEGLDDQVEKVIDVIDAFRLQTIGAFDKKGALAWAKTYLKTIKERLDKENPERSQQFQEKSQKWIKEVLLKDIDNFEFYTGPSFNTEGSLAMFTYEGEDISPTMYLFKDGLIEEKC